MFNNREHAGQLLAKKVLETLELADKAGHAPETIVVGLPRGGVPVACEVALALGSPLGILVSKKIGAPFQPELAIGAVSSSGIVVLNEDMETFSSRIREYINSETVRLSNATRIMEQNWLDAAGIKEKPEIAGKRVVLVDDGVATGMTTLAAIRSLRSQGAQEIILATPLISVGIHNRLQAECDLIISLITPYGFSAIGQYYEDFSQVEDEEVVISLKATRSKVAAAARGRAAAI